MSDKKEEFEATDQRTMSEEKKKRKKWRIKQNGRWFKIDKKCIKESATLRQFYGTTFFSRVSLNIKRTSILIKALDFCKKRGEIKTTYEFDSDFLKRINNNYDDDTIIDLIDAAGKLDIESLFNLLFEDVVDKIAHKTPQDIAEIFKIRYKKDDDEQFKMMNLVMDGSDWPLTEVM